jgi:hypothetical protein
MIGVKVGGLGTVEDQRNIALDVRELIRKRVFERPVGSVFQLNIAFPWQREMRLNADSLDLCTASAVGMGCALCGSSYV